jgi:hypothetical protein
MAKIDVKVRSDVGDPGCHPKYGQLVPGTTMTIEEEEFGAGLFERPAKDWLSPHEQADKARAAEEGRKVGDFDPPAEQKKPVAAAAPESGKTGGDL